MLKGIRDTVSPRARVYYTKGCDLLNRYMDKEALYPFGYGLSYSRFEYSAIPLDRTTMLEPGHQTTVSFQLTSWDIAVVTESGDRQVEPGTFQMFVGGSQPDARSHRLTGVAVQSADFSAEGPVTPLAYPKL